MSADTPINEKALDPVTNPAEHVSEQQDISAAILDEALASRRWTDPEDMLPAYDQVRFNEDPRTTAKELHQTITALGTELPMTQSTGWWNSLEFNEATVLLRDVSQLFHNAIASKKDEIVAVLIEEGLVTANTTDRFGQSPLNIAVDQGDIRMVQQLLDFDAQVNAFTRYRGHVGQWEESCPDRTPLMVAAFRGNLALVKLLMEVYHADDSLIAPDGEIALRLAAKHNHREIVQYLPSRRAGGWQRWKHKHSRAMRRARRAAGTIRDIGVFFVYRLPKFALTTIRDIGQYVWKHRADVLDCCIWLIRDFPIELAKAIGRTIKKTPDLVRRALKKMPGLYAEFIAFLKRIPAALTLVGKWLWRGASAVGEAITAVTLELVSILHTIFVKVLHLVQGVTWANIWNALKAIPRAIFVTLPIKLWTWLESFGELLYKVSKTLFGTLGKVVVFVLWLLWLAITWIPKLLGTIITSFATSITKLVEEILVYINPKR